MKHDHSKTQDTVELPTPTAWPIVTAFGLTLFFAAFVTHLVFAVVGVVVGLVGWRGLVPGSFSASQTRAGARPSAFGAS